MTDKLTGLEAQTVIKRMPPGTREAFHESDAQFRKLLALPGFHRGRRAVRDGVLYIGPTVTERCPDRLLLADAALDKIEEGVV